MNTNARTQTAQVVGRLIKRHTTVSQKEGVALMWLTTFKHCACTVMAGNMESIMSNRDARGRKANKHLFKGKMRTVEEIAGLDEVMALGLSYRTILNRMNRDGMSLEEAVTRPLRRRLVGEGNSEWQKLGENRGRLEVGAVL